MTGVPSWIDDAEPLHGVGQPADQSRRVHRGAVRREGAAEDAVGSDPRTGLGTGQQAQILLAHAPLPLERHLRLEPAGLQRRGRQAQVAALGRGGVDALRVGHPQHLVDGRLRRALPRRRRGGRRGRGDRVPPDRQQAREPAAVAAGGAEAGELPLEDDDAQTRVTSREVVRRPQPGVPGTDHRDVGLDPAGQGRPPALEVAGGQAVVPQGQRPRWARGRHGTSWGRYSVALSAGTHSTGRSEICSSLCGTEPRMAPRSGTLPAGADDDHPRVVPVGRVDERLGGLGVEHLDDRRHPGGVGLGHRVPDRRPADLGQRPLVRAELLAHAARGLRAVDQDQRLLEAGRQRDGHRQGRPRAGRLVVAQDDAHRRSSATSMRSPATPGRSCQYRLSLARQTNIRTTPTRKMPIPMTSGGPTPSQACPV